MVNKYILAPISNKKDKDFKDFGRRSIYLCLLTVFLVFSSAEVFAEKPVEDGSRKVAVITFTSNAGSLRSFRDVINSAVAVEMKVAGYSPLFTGVSRINNSDVSDVGVAFLIENSYDIDGSAIRINFSCYRTDLNSVIYRSTKNGKLDLELDAMIQGAAEEFLPLMEESLRSDPFISAESKKNDVLEARTAVSSEASSGAPVFSRDLQPEHTGIEKVSNYPVLRSESPEGPGLPNITGAVSGTPRKKYLTVSAGFSPFLTTGDASGYFTMGYMPEFYTGIRLLKDHGFIGLGLSGSVNYFRARGILLSSDNLLISAAPEIRIGAQMNDFLGFLFRMSGGAAAFMLNKNNEGYMTAYIPYVSGGMGVSAAFSGRAGLMIMMNYTVYIESSILISGFSPSLGAFFLL